MTAVLQHTYAPRGTAGELHCAPALEPDLALTPWLAGRDVHFTIEQPGSAS